LFVEEAAAILFEKKIVSDIDLAINFFIKVLGLQKPIEK
jgi:hypothetical protein